MTDAHVLDNRGDDRTSSTLLDRIKAHQPEAWRRFVHLYSPLVYEWGRRAGLQHADVADVGQEIFRAVARTISGYRHDRQGDSFRGWLRTIATNKIRDHCRKVPAEGNGQGGSTLSRRLLEVEDVRLPDDEAAQHDERLLLLRRALTIVLGDCEEVTRQAFYRVIAGEAPADVARDLGLTVNAVYVLKGRLLKRLREEFAGLIEM